jgi:predicted benzoate:H+ symporter BenE
MFVSVNGVEIPMRRGFSLCIVLAFIGRCDRHLTLSQVAVDECCTTTLARSPAFVCTLARIAREMPVALAAGLSAGLLLVIGKVYKPPNDY